MLAQFRQRYPQGSIISELIDIHHGKYIVRVSVGVEQITLATGLAAADTVELAEDQAQHRALRGLNLEVKTEVATETSAAAVESKHSGAVEAASTPSEQSQASEELSGQLDTSESIKHQDSQPQPVDAVDDQNQSHPAATTELTKTNGSKPASNPSTTATTATEKNQELELTPPTPQPVTEINTPQPELELTPTTPEPTPVEPPQLEVAQTPTETETADSDTGPAQLDFHDVIGKTDIELKRLGWTTEQGRDYLIQTYGKRSRVYLTDDELLEFLHYLETLPTPG